jgi:hypothetical protein
MSKQSKDVPISAPYCSDPTCAYCKDLRGAEEELRYKTRLAELIDELKKAATQGGERVLNDGSSLKHCTKLSPPGSSQ